VKGARGCAVTPGAPGPPLPPRPAGRRIQTRRPTLDTYAPPPAPAPGAGAGRRAARRAAPVRRYLHTEGGIPLHHLAVSPRGGGAAAAVDGSPEAPESGHRVVVVVLR
jgi:hypothetical protein